MPLVRRGFLIKTFVVSLALGALLGGAGISFVGFERPQAMVAPDDPEAQLGVAVASPDGQWVALHVWRGDAESPQASGTYLIDLATTEPHPLPGVVPMPEAWDAVGNLRVLSSRDGDMRTIVPATRELLNSASAHEELLLAEAPRWRPRWCELETLASDEESPRLMVRWAEEELEAEFPTGPGHHTQATDMEGIVFHSVVADGSMRIERHDLLTDTLRVVVDHLAESDTEFSASRDGTLLIVVEHTTCRLVDAESGETLGETWKGSWARWVESGTGHQLVADRAGRVELLDVDSSEVVTLGQSQLNSSWRITLLSDGRMLVHKGHSLDLHDPAGTLLTTLFPLPRPLP